MSTTVATCPPAETGAGVQGVSRALDRYRIDPPDGAPVEPCDRHPDAFRVYAEIPVRDLTDGERPAVVRGWTCPRCFTARGIAVDGEMV